jgi:hypothetical protein
MEATTIELAHHVTAVTDGVEHRAECSCGWVSEWYPDDVDAVTAAVEHPEIAVGPADGFDVFMSGLLDVQDDLARLVEWMAENWSADLPVPALWEPASESRGELGVSVFCATSAELARVAERIGAPITGNARYGSDTATYRCAVRRFGRVVVEAWRYER